MVPTNMKVVTVEEMRHIEAASDAAGHSYAAMMEQAGRGVAEAIIARGAARGRILVLVGPGNNGGDGLVAARLLAEAGATVTCYLTKPRDPAGDANLRLVQEQGLSILLTAEDEELRDLARLAGEADVVVDALLGTGTRLPLRGRLAQVLSRVKQALADRRGESQPSLTPLAPGPAPPARGPLVVAVDGPSGLDYCQGALDETAIPADVTVTFAYPKVGHFSFPAAGALGELVVADIGTDPALAADVALEVATPGVVDEWLPPRPPDAHKGTFGKALIVAGSVHYTGAAYLAAAAATRAGAGLVTLALPAAIHGAVAARLAEATYLPLPDESGFVAGGAVDVFSDRLEEYDALLVGPGLGQQRETAEFFRALLEKAGSTRLVIDADGLNLLSKVDGWETLLPPGTILTPHPGEMARLTGAPTRRVQADRLEMARSRAAAWGQVVVLKGAHTVVAAPDGRIILVPFANAGLATAGTGDVLAGTIVALCAQGLGAFEAATAGAYLHGLAGEMARSELGAAGMVAGDVLARIPHAWRRLSAPA